MAASTTKRDIPLLVDDFLYKGLLSKLGEIYTEARNNLNSCEDFEYQFFRPSLCSEWVRGTPTCLIHKLAVKEYLDPYIDMYGPLLDSRRKILEFLLRFLNQTESPSALRLLLPPAVADAVWVSPETTVVLSDYDIEVVEQHKGHPALSLIKQQMVFNTFG